MFKKRLEGKNYALKILSRFAAVLAAGLLTVIFINFLPMPFIWISFLWFIVFLYLSKTSARTSIKMLLYYISFIPFTFGIFETGQWIFKNHQANIDDYGGGPTEIDEFREIYPKGSINLKHEVLGYAPLPDTRPRHIKYYKDKLCFDVVYTINSDGLRISPPYQPGKTIGSILFFGDSFMFGEGVKDEETLAYRTGIRTGGKYHIYNFGYRGYGTHQMLSAIEHGMVEHIVKEPPKFVIYEANFYQIGRAAGMRVVEWDTHGPKYTLKENGEVAYDGHFNKKKLAFAEYLKTCKTLNNIVLRHRGYSKKQVDLFIALVDKSRNLLETHYPGCEFHVILWDNPKQGNNAEVIERFKKIGIRLHLIRDIYKQYRSILHFKKSQLIIKYDRHPSPLAHDIISDYVVNKIIHRSDVETQNFTSLPPNDEH
jgi:hypothetical protein